MTITKADISKKISDDLEITISDSKDFLNAFLNDFKKVPINKEIKLSGFGTFFWKLTAKRIGRNPKTKESYIIQARKKLSFNASTITKNFLN